MLRAATLGLITLWRRGVSPWLSPACRFYPSCSAYASEAIASRGLAQGGWLALKRLARCHPFHPGGVDLPPGREA
ncbi:MAG: membrane protein insertion efficiency factor YidD [bacterium]|nr:membrane protein insertion efficiency factor YidD [bacterium]